MVSERNPGTAQIVVGALVDLLTSIPQRADDLVLIGGLVPPYLTAGSGQVHQGTTDVDLLVDIGMVFDDDRDFAWLEAALFGSGFEPEMPGWRWTRTTRGVTVLLDLLCERSAYTSEVIALPGAHKAAAMNLPGTHAARCDATRQLVTDGHGGECEVRVAGLGGFLLAKCAAISKRDADKDLYDISFVVLHNPGGPDGAAEAVLAHPCREHVADYEQWLRTVAALFNSPDAAGPLAYAMGAEQMSGADRDIAAQDAYAALTAFLTLVLPAN